MAFRKEPTPWDGQKKPKPPPQPPSTKQIDFIGELQKVNVKPGDVFILTCPHKHSQDDRTSIMNNWQKQMPDHNLIVLYDGAKMNVVSKEDNEQAHH